MGFWSVVYVAMPVGMAIAVVVIVSMRVVMRIAVSNCEAFLRGNASLLLQLLHTTRMERSRVSTRNLLTCVR